jgi:hypothetical protein
MAWAPLVFQIAGTVLSVAGAMSAAQAQKRQAQQAQQLKEYEAAQMEQNAGQELAAGQRRAMEERRRATMLASRALAVGAASGGGTSGSVEEIISDIAGEGAYRAGLEIFGSEDRARRLRMGAEGARYEGDSIASYGRSQATASSLSAVGALGRFAGSPAVRDEASALFSRYGRGGPRTDSFYYDAGPTDSRFA